MCKPYTFYQQLEDNGNEQSNVDDFFFFPPFACTFPCSIAGNQLSLGALVGEEYEILSEIVSVAGEILVEALTSSVDKLRLPPFVSPATSVGMFSD